MNLKLSFLFFFFNITATTEIYTLSLHDALPISRTVEIFHKGERIAAHQRMSGNHKHTTVPEDRKSTRLNSSHPSISYAVFCLKKKMLCFIAFSNVSAQYTEMINTTRPGGSQGAF